MSKKIIATPIVLLCALIFLVVPTFAHENKAKVIPAQAVISAFGLGGNSIPKGTFSTVVNYIYADKDRVWVSGSNYKSKSENVFNFVGLKLLYAIDDNWSIRTFTPYIDNNISNAPNKSSIGDTVLIVRRVLLSQQDGYPFSIAAGLGLHIPTGDTSFDGVGTGAWGLMPEIGITYSFDNGRQAIEVGGDYLWRGYGTIENNKGKANHDIDQPDRIRFFGRYVYALNNYLDIGIETQYEHSFASMNNDKSMHNSSTSLFAGPALTLKIPQWKASLGFSTQFALYQDFENAHCDGRGMPSEDFRFEMKFAKSF